MKDFNILRKKYKVGSYGIKKRTYPNILHLTRVIKYLSFVNTKVNQTTIKDSTCMTHLQTQSVLNWLVNNKIIIKERGNASITTNFYYINPKWKELKNEQF